jgi:hypothetical protein
VHFSLHARLAGAASIRHSLRPLSFEGHRLARLGRKSRREDAEVRHDAGLFENRIRKAQMAETSPAMTTLLLIVQRN